MAMNQDGREVVRSILNDQGTVEDLKDFIDPNPKSELGVELNAEVDAAIKRRQEGGGTGG
ncbi:hypothetical protein [Streptomyces sp. 5-10]|uniref:hypothetical protein n=1 Tax=Streptomyces sp. 5-10 TaxID=878925 RepID=UPI00168B8895|nr:hypothetical protein [Streptomyces sp. 5-10]MBD3004728.1 hypothetical protein [Streptomyces sp. 5-10]